MFQMSQYERQTRRLQPEHPDGAVRVQRGAEMLHVCKIDIDQLDGMR